MEARKLSAALAVGEISERAAFMALEPEWDALVAASDDQPFYRHAFLRSWLDHFAPARRWRILIARNELGTLVGALALVEERAWMFGVLVRQLVAAANPHSCRFDLIARDRTHVGQAFLRHLSADKNWDVLRLIDVPQGGAASHLYEQARAQGLPVGIWQSINSPYVSLPVTHDALLASLHSKLKANCRRRRKKLEARGAVSVERVTGGPQLGARLAEAFTVEQSGWKGALGTAIGQSAATRGFYTELAHTAAAEGWLSLYFLRCGGRAVAFQYGLTYRGKYLLLKPGYDEAFKECSPGQLLMHEVLRDCIERGLSELDFLGPDMLWKRDWTDRARAHIWLFVFRDSALGRTLREAKFGWVPAARERLRRWTK
jgi:CelD/BcsL family acetyltransferase involved in cellulose biosynthesis